MTDDEAFAMEVLWYFPGDTLIERARAAIERIEYLERLVYVAETNEKAAWAVMESDRAELEQLRRIVHRRFPYQGGGHEQVARQTSRVTGT